VCACFFQKLKRRRARLSQLGGATKFVAASAVSTEWCSCASPSVAEAELPRLLDFLVSHDGLDFHSDEDDVQLETSQVSEPDGGAAAVPTITTLAHSFRSPLAATMLRSLDEPAQLPPLRSDCVGALLSVRMAVVLQQRPDLASLINKSHVDLVAQGKKTRARSLTTSMQEQLQTTLDAAVIEVNTAGTQMQHTTQHT